jgi:peptidoglycan biosynthesis protein MviN/MurJ (putative lipid II flippase)
LKLDERLTGGGPRIIGAALYAAAVAWLIAPCLQAVLSGVTTLHNELYLALLGLVALFAYVVMLLGLGWKR